MGTTQALTHTPLVLVPFQSKNTTMEKVWMIWFVFMSHCKLIDIFHVLWHFNLVPCVHSARLSKWQLREAVVLKSNLDDASGRGIRLHSQTHLVPFSLSSWLQGHISLKLSHFIVSIEKSKCIYQSLFLEDSCISKSLQKLWPLI